MMAKPPDQHECSFPDCNFGPSGTSYVTIKSLPGYDLVIQDLRKPMDIHDAMNRTQRAPSGSVDMVTKLKIPMVSYQCTLSVTLKEAANNDDAEKKDTEQGLMAVKGQNVSVNRVTDYRNQSNEAKQDRVNTAG